ncbi:Early nodulin-like protein [Thalictrum thalictroides]|uniref:Early nodulin-like protein n=1 Tax=Thalictrum thalictroides TaxID=46969 RepID=A0A7J6WZV0_THATH|nr:Early nodulin-like protein [Thalictrum thalictroides]
MNICGSDAFTRFKVGESIGWRMPDENDTALYSQWAAKNRFLVGDSLYFEYRNDSVLMVNKGGYYHCNTTNPISTSNDGKTVIKLEKPGPAYFISGTPEHCKKGQRLLIDVMTHPHPPSPPSPPSIAVPPQPFFPVSPAPSPNQSSGISVSVAWVSVLVVLTTTILKLV